eukprot:TRINITY_DN1545_c0_g1_i1.p1 TRINITY_DN1545_c0_g1~~TRINITY_DN1545_c0_g1_i1.p1  ORF type:complete len:310 (+),score=112.90 TRINITY_DN1545_c0_g1_i1:166-1095(+)
MEVPSDQSSPLNEHIKQEKNAEAEQLNTNTNNNNASNNGLGEDETSQDSNTSGIAAKNSATLNKKGAKRSTKTPKKNAAVSTGGDNNGTNVGGEQTPLKPSSMPRHTVNPEKRRLENEAYAAVLTAFRVQGELTWEKESLLQDLRYHLKIADERHRVETKRLEDMIYPNRAQKRSRNEEGTVVSEGDESDLNANHEEEGPRMEGDSLLTAISAPPTDSTPGWLNKPPDFTKPPPKKSKETPKKRMKKEEKKPGTGKYRKDAPIPVLVKTKDEKSDGALPPDVIAAKEAGDESKMRESKILFNIFAFLCN